MKNRSMNVESKMFLGLALCLALVATAGYAAQDVVAVGPALSKGDTDGNVTYSAVGAYGINVAFPRSGVTVPLSGQVVVDQGVEGSPFIGNYVEDAINTISLEVSGSGHQPGVARLVLKSATRRWRQDINFPADGSTATIAFALRSADGWVTTGLDGASDAELNAALGADLVDVRELYIVLLPERIDAYYPAQDYTIDNFVLINDDGISSRPGSLSPLEKAFIGRFGYGYGSPHSLTEEMRRWDEDGDGMADFMELWCENDEEYANSIFSAEDIEVVSGGVNVTWSCVAGETYTVLKADSLTGVFGPVAGATAIAEETGYMTLPVTTAGAGSYYRIRKH